jgi:hypothetical protein
MVIIFSSEEGLLGLLEAMVKTYDEFFRKTGIYEAVEAIREALKKDPTPAPASDAGGNSTTKRK